MEWHLIGIFACVVIYNLYRYYHDDSDNDTCSVTTTTPEDHQVEETNMEETICTRQLVQKTIKDIGSEPIERDELRIQFEYQGVTFLMEAVDDCMFVNLIWPWCHSFSKFDIDEFARVRQVVNDMNMRDTLSVFYIITDDDDVAVHLKKHFLFVQQIPNLKDYLRIILDCFFKTARTLDIEVEKCRLQAGQG